MSSGWPDGGSGWAVVGSERPGRADVAMRHGRGRNLWQKRDVHVRKHRLLPRRKHMDAIIYLVGLVVIVMAILSFFGLR
jgi:hypothetical protein